MPEINVEVEIYCSCGEGLCNQSIGGNKRGVPNITVEPCPKCLGNAEDDGWDKGHSEAKREAE